MRTRAAYEEEESFLGRPTGFIAELVLAAATIQERRAEEEERRRRREAWARARASVRGCRRPANERYGGLTTRVTIAAIAASIATATNGLSSFF